MKTNKSYAKRLRVTKTGKVIGRKAGINHFNAKAPRTKQLNGKRPIQINMSNKSASRFLSGIK